ncbi:MAG: CBS domain-containing protein, partial [candidate division Zixibacteria bacterium]|nr:CBS domain-containing protein [candidate division Zixibacteria bacterium]
AYALVGMAGIVAGATHAPITALLIIFEMTSDYRIILPLMVTVVFSVLVAGRLFSHSIYTVKLAKRGIDLRGGRDINVLKAHKVSEVMTTEFETIGASTILSDIFHIIERSTESYFMVTDRGGKLKGVLSFQDIRNLITERALDQLVIAQDLVSPDPIVLTTEDDLEQAYALFGQRDFVLIPVVAPENTDVVIGVLRRENLIDYYNKRLLDTLRR